MEEAEVTAEKRGDVLFPVRNKVWESDKNLVLAKSVREEKESLAQSSKNFDLKISRIAIK